MVIRALACLLGAAVLLVSGLQLTAGDKTEAIKLDLKTFKFKVADNIANLFGYNEDESKLFFYTNGTGEAKVKVPDDGDYEIVIKASGDVALKEGAKFKVAVDGKQTGKDADAEIQHEQH